jgi:phosphoribosyl-ATP pyrophosphohydrolase/phosphoribosyl-AMP cyclohydrolase
MLIPSIDIQSGQAVQLIGGRTLAIEAGDPASVAARFGVAGELAVIDLDAALGQGQNDEVIAALVRRYECRVGGGIRDEATARRWLDRGASHIILGTAANADFVRKLPRSRVIAALDAQDGVVMSHGWRQSTGESVEAAMMRLAPVVGGFLVTAIEREGRMSGLDMTNAARWRRVAGDRRLTMAGGVASAAEVAALDTLGIDVQAGMALYRGTFSVADAFAAILTTRTGGGAWPTVVVDESGRALGLTHSTAASLAVACDERIGAYWSRRRGLWRKGATSGATQQLLRIDLDCDRDALRFTVRQAEPGFCHTEAPACWPTPWGMPALERSVTAAIASGSDASYARRVMSSPDLLAAKLREEAAELVEAQGDDAVLEEAADLFFFTYLKLRQSGWRLADLDGVLARRAGRVTRRGGEAKTAINAMPRLEVRS